MKILTKKNVDKPDFPIIITCAYCESELEVDRDDLQYGYLGCAHVVCPVCGEEIYSGLEQYDEEFNYDTFEFPKHFYHFDCKDGAVDISPEEIKKYIQDGIKHFRKNPEAFCYHTGSGDTSVFVLNYSGDEEYAAVVAKGYYETEIPYAEEDYKAQENSDWEWENKPTSNIATWRRKI